MTRYGETTPAAELAHGESGARFTPGLLRALTAPGVYYICRCGMPIPRYAGRYPKHCPICRNPIDVNQDGEPDDAE